jgi:hypothetical protein
MTEIRPSSLPWRSGFGPLLAGRLAALDLEQLRDVVAFYGMDPRRLVMKWKTTERVVAHIVETVQTRSRKGDAFRAPSASA